MELPWHNIVLETRDYTVVREGFPVAEGHIIFVPVADTPEKILVCYKAAIGWGAGWVSEGFCDAYNMVQSVGRVAGQAVLYPHVHLIPRRADSQVNIMAWSSMMGISSRTDDTLGSQRRDT